MTPVAQPDRAQVNALYRVARLLGAAVTATTFRRSCRSCQVGDDLLGTINTTADTITLYCANCTEAEIVAAFNLTLADLSCAADRAALNGHAAADGGAGKGDGFTWLDDLLDEPDALHRWNVYELLTPGGISIVNARPKTGKSTLMRTLAVAQASGVPFLGRATRAGKVLYLCHEEQREEVKRSFRRLSPQRGLQIAIWANPAPERSVTWLTEIIEQHRPTLVIIDTLSAFFSVEDINSNSEMTRHLKPVLALARESGTHICIVHWMGKGSEGALGATSIFGTVDCSINITTDESGRRIIVTEGQRSGVPIPRTVLALHPTTGASDLAGEIEWVQMESCAGEILDLLQGEALTETKIAERVEMRAITVSRTLRELKQRGFLLTNRQGGTTYYRLGSTPVPRPVFGRLGQAEVGTTGTPGTDGTTGTADDPEEQII